MPAPQLKQAISFTKKIKELYKNVITILVGCFPSNQKEEVINLDYVDYVINGTGNFAFPEFLDALENNKPLDLMKNMAFKNKGTIIITPAAEILNQIVCRLYLMIILTNFIL